MLKGLFNAIENTRVAMNARAVLAGRYDRMVPKGTNGLYERLGSEVEELKKLKKLRKQYFYEWISCLLQSGKVLAQPVSEQRDCEYCCINEDLGPSAYKDMMKAQARITATHKQIESTICEIDRRWYPNRKQVN